MSQDPSWLDRTTIIAVENLAARAWPATLIEDLDGWDLRWSRAPTNRTNSVRPRRHGGRISIGDKLASVEAFYRGRGRPSLYQISPGAEPHDLDARLQERGYLRYDSSVFQIAPLTEVAALTATSPDLRAVTSAALSHRWCESWIEFSQTNELTTSDLVEVLHKVASPTIFVVLEVSGTPIALGRGVSDGSWLGVFNMATSVRARGKGAGAAVLGAIARWGIERNATHAYLQVDADNYAALRLYQRSGFTTHHHYWYRISQLAAPEPC